MQIALGLWPSCHLFPKVYLHDFIKQYRFDFQVFKVTNVARSLDGFLFQREQKYNPWWQQLLNVYVVTIRQCSWPSHKHPRADLWVQVPEDVHPGLLHHGKQIRIVMRPLHVPNILALKLGRIPCRRLVSCAVVCGGTDVQVQQRQHARNVDYGQTAR